MPASCLLITAYSTQTPVECQEDLPAAHFRGHHAGRRNSRCLWERQSVHRQQRFQGSAAAVANSKCHTILHCLNIKNVGGISVLHVAH